MGSYVVTMQKHTSGNNIVVCTESDVFTNGWTLKTINFTDPTAGSGLSRNRGISCSSSSVTVVSDSITYDTEIATTNSGDTSNWSINPASFNLVPLPVAEDLEIFDKYASHRWLFNNKRRLMIIVHQDNNLNVQRSCGIWIESADAPNNFYNSLDRLHIYHGGSSSDAILNIKYNYVNTNQQFVVGTTTHEYISDDTAGVKDWDVDYVNTPYVYGYNSTTSSSYVKWTVDTIEIAEIEYLKSDVDVLGDFNVATISSTNPNEVVTITTSNEVAITVDSGVSWIVSALPISNSELVTRVCHGNGIYVALATTDGVNIQHSLTSTDGINWTPHLNVFNDTFLSAAGDNTRTITYGNGVFVTVGYTPSGGRIYTSVDGIVWTERFIGHFTSTDYSEFNIRKVIFGNGIFLLTMESGLLCMSTNGIDWQPLNRDSRYRHLGGYFRDISYIYKFGYFVGSISSDLFFSFDGVAWHRFYMSALTSSSAFGGLLSYNILAIHYFIGKLVLILPGSSNSVCTVVSGASDIGWTRRQIPVSANHRLFSPDNVVRQYAWYEYSPTTATFPGT
ncbi:MAG: hypothetical protein CTY12_06335 [Methylotenera sp.]|nr:MAG: hypothetical protein CTY12_06335 [Methylotenera sp.]